MSVTLLPDALRSEAYRLVRNRMAVFWSVFFVPLLFVLGGLIYHWVNKSKAAELAAAANLPADLLAAAPVNLMDGLGVGVSAMANGAVLVFMLIGAATLYAGDYRWETWRLTSARNSRVNLILGKVAVFKLAALATMATFLIAGLIFSLTEALIYGKSLTIDPEGFEAGQFVLLVLLAWVRIVQYAMIALLTAVVTRSLLASLFVPVVIGFAQSLLGGPGLPLLGWEPTQWQAQLLLPGLAYDTLKATIGVAPGQPDGLALKAIVSLTLWTLAPLAAAIAWFGRQDLSKE
jgi:ABC-2 type transport system permease protein